MHLVLIGLGGFAGAITRYLVDGWVVRATAGSFPWGTLVVNVSGSFLLGLLAAMTIDRATVTCPGSASATPAKITARAQSPRINLMMGRIASLLSCAQTAYLARPACAQAGQAPRFLTENDYISPVNKREGWR
jgi:hypothetical protein